MWLNLVAISRKNNSVDSIQSGYLGLNTVNGKKRSSIHAQLVQATCVAVASFLSISCVQPLCTTLAIRSFFSGLLVFPSQSVARKEEKRE